MKIKLLAIIFLLVQVSFAQTLNFTSNNQLRRSDITVSSKEIVFAFIADSSQLFMDGKLLPLINSGQEESWDSKTGENRECCYRLRNDELECVWDIVVDCKTKTHIKEIRKIGYYGNGYIYYRRVGK